jgi:hypothetical protein
MADKTLPPVAIGDSLAVGMRDANKIPGLGRVGAGPREVLDMIKRFSMENSLSGRDVFIGTGLPNIPAQKKFIEEQIDFVRKQGGNPILMGVGPGTKKKPTTGQNEFLAGLAESKGLKYMGPLANSFPDITKDPMGLHLRGPQYQQIFKQYSKPQSQQVQPQVQPQSRAPSAASLLSQFTGAVMQAESRGKRYDKSGKLLTSPKGAMGEMQVMPGTVRDPGFGVRPAKDNSPDELARVGRDYAAAMLRRYNNDPTAAAVAYNWGPGNADKWVKRGADFNALPKETQKYVTRITGQMGIPIAAKRAPAPKRADVPPVPPQKRAETPPQKRAAAEEFDGESTLELSSRPAEQPQGQITRADMDRLGPSYQAAFAAMSLADSREDDNDFYDDDETIAERYMERREMQMAQDDYTLEEEEPARVSPLAGLSEITYQSPFAEQQPVMMANGGEAKSELDRVRAAVDRTAADPAQRMYAKLSDIATKGLINIYDAARLTEGALSSKESAAEKEQRMSAAHKIYLDTFGFRGRRDPVTAEYFNPEEQKAIAALIAKKGGQKGSIQYKDYGRDKRDVQKTDILSGRLDPYLSVEKSLGQFNYEFDPKTKSYRVTDQYDFNPLVDTGGRQINTDYLGDYLSDVPSLYNKARIYGGRHMPPGTGRKVDFMVPAQVPVKRAEGSPVYGEVSGNNPQGYGEATVVDPTMRERLAGFLTDNLVNLGADRYKARGRVESFIGGPSSRLPLNLGLSDFVPFLGTFMQSEEAAALLGKAKDAAKRGDIKTAAIEGISGALGLIPGASGTVKYGKKAVKAAEPTAKDLMKSLGPQVEETLMKAAPAAKPLGIVSDARKMLMEVPEASLFVSKVDDFIASQKGPVTKQQLLGQMKGKFRDYEIGRVSAALANYKDTEKFMPEYLLSAVQSSYPASKLKTYVLEPQKVDRWASTDNVYFDQPVGVVNLRFDTPMENVYKSLSNQEALERLAWVTSPTRFATADRKAQDVADLAGAIRGLPDANKFNELLGDMDRLYTSKSKTDTMLAEIDNAYSSYKYPATKDGWSTAINEYYAKNKGPSMFEDAKKYADDVVQKEADKKLKSYGIDIPSKSLPPEEFMDKLQTKVANQMYLVSQKEKDAVVALNEKFYPELTEAAKAFKSNSLYEGQHKSLTPKGTPIAFSRFVDHTVNLPDKGETKVMHMIELQSDLLDDIRKYGSKSGSKVQDLENLLKTEASIKKILKEDPRLVDPAKKLDHIRSTYPNSSPVEKSEAYRSIIKENPEIEKELIEYMKLRDKESKLNVRSYQGKYDLEEAFPGMEMSPQVVQQMMIKNAIGGAMQRGVNAVTFPGKESKQAQLYEKLYPNLKQVAKDLGPGFDVRQIELYDSLGNPYSHWGVVWDDNTSKKILNTGIRFNKGGLVEKQDTDNRTFI